MSAVLDTHTVLWYLQYSSELSATARVTIEDSIRNANAVFVSVVSVIETIYLVERRRVAAGVLNDLRHVLAEPTSGLAVAPVDLSIATAMDRIPRSAVPDMPDRIVAATALHLDLPLITRDRRLQAAGIKTIW